MTETNDQVTPIIPLLCCEDTCGRNHNRNMNLRSIHYHDKRSNLNAELIAPPPPALKEV